MFILLQTQQQRTIKEEEQILSDDCSPKDSKTQQSYVCELINTLIKKQRSRSLSELTRQITPPTKNGHAPPPLESRKNHYNVYSTGLFNLSILPKSGPGKIPRVESN